MEPRTRFPIVSLILAIVFFSTSSVYAEMDVGDYTISGSAEVDGLPRAFQGDQSRFQGYRDIPESVVVPQLELMIGSKKQDFFFNFDAGSVGRDDQNYRLKFGRYGLFNVEFEWNQIPHVFQYRQCTHALCDARRHLHLAGQTVGYGHQQQCFELLEPIQHLA